MLNGNAASVPFSATHLKMIEQASRSGNKQIDTLSELLGFGLAICTSHDDGESLVVVLTQLLRHTENLQGQFARR